MDSLHMGIVIGVSSTFTICCIIIGVYRSCISRSHSYLKESRSDTDLAGLDTSA